MVEYSASVRGTDAQFSVESYQIANLVIYLLSLALNLVLNLRAR